MSLPLCQLALDKLINFQSYEGSDAAETLVGLAANFVHELQRADREGQLVTRANDFENTTEQGSDFDRCRADVVSAISGTDGKPKVLMLPEVEPDFPPRIRKRTLMKREGDNWIVPDTPRGPETNVIPQILKKLESLEALRWGLKGAFDDSKVLLKLEAAPPALQSWHAILRKLKVRDEQGNLFGCYLLNRCYKVHDAEPGDVIRLELTERLSRDFVRLFGVIRQAAEYLQAEAEQTQAANPTPRENAPDQEGERSGQGAMPAHHDQVEGNKKIPKGYHHPDEIKPAIYDKGPIVGNQKTMAKVICKVCHKAKDARALKKLGESGEIWIEYVSPQLIKVYFKNQVIYSNANVELVKIREEKDKLKKIRAEKDN